MSIAPVHENGTSIYYEDTGAPGSAEDYTTFVLIHGFSINSGIFRKTFAYARHHNVRIITMNMRDYFGSTPYAADEMLAFTNPDTCGDAVRGWAREIASFLLFVAEHLGVPKLEKSPTGDTGGIVVVPWSLSNATILSMFGDPDALDVKSRAGLAPYLRKVIMNDPPCLIFGICPEGIYSPLLDQSLTPLQMGRDFQHWVSAYYPAIPDLASITYETLLQYPALDTPRPTSEMLSASEALSTMDATVVARSGSTLTVDPRVFNTNFRRTFLDAAIFLEDIEFVALWCNQTNWFCQWGAKNLADILDEEPVLGAKKRRLSIVKVENANHFFHWECPAEFVEFLVEQTRSPASCASEKEIGPGRIARL